MDRLTLTQNTKLSDIADFMARQDQNATVLAKKDDQGNTVLYTREANKLKGIGGLFTAIKDKYLESKGEGKAAFAQAEVQSFVQGLAKTTTNPLYDKADLAKGGHTAVDKLANTIDYSGQLLGLDKPTVGQMTKVISSLEMLTETVTNVLESKIALKDDVPPFPPTQNKPLGGGTTQLDGMGRAVTTPDLEIGGKAYTCEKLIGTGGGGTVYSYVAQDGSKLAVKVPPDMFAAVDADEKNEAARRELGNNTRVMGGNQNVTGFSQHVMMPNGLVALVGEIMPNGDLTKLANTLNDAHFPIGDLVEGMPSGMIGDLEHKLVGLTLLQDASKGLVGLNDGNGITHGDTKSQNVMIDANGVGKLIDLGESTKTDTIRPGNYEFPDNAMYRAPEVTKLKNDDKIRKPEVKTANTEIFAAMADGLMDSFGLNPAEFQPGVVDDFTATVQGMVSDLSKDLSEMVALRQNSDLTVGNTFDTFGLGTVGFELLVGGRATQDIEGKFSADTGKAVEKWRVTGNDFIGVGGITNRSSGDADLDRLLNGMLKSDPKERMTAAQVRDDPLMSTPGVGSPEVRELIVALASGDATAIDTARDKVREKFGNTV
jgi:serine/threonine protein kinase